MKEENDNIRCLGTPLYKSNHSVIRKPKVTDSMRNDMKKFISKL